MKLLSRQKSKVIRVEDTHVDETSAIVRRSEGTVIDVDSTVKNIYDASIFIDEYLHAEPGKLSEIGMMQH